jgi:hypothetical protein
MPDEAQSQTGSETTPASEPAPSTPAKDPTPAYQPPPPDPNLWHWVEKRGDAPLPHEAH